MTSEARGATRVADRVVAKIAMQGAREALRASSPAHTGGAAAGSTTATARARVSVHRQGENGFGEARVQVSVDLGYPTPIGIQCAEVRRRVSERVESLAGMTVLQVAVRVERLGGPQPSGRERVR
ncbi:Asp23/Gls24 family envelope stress response protein [Streptomyces sp. NPDC004134]|uniref:Asp23/Gls24 family envelope stress response protein n=1 Tax=Streptomyces sp. NPDC004134 TaxID=3364691 RepID=UPI0036AA8A8F